MALNHLVDEFDKLQDPSKTTETPIKQSSPNNSSKNQSSSFQNKRERDRQMKKSSNSPKTMNSRDQNYKIATQTSSKGSKSNSGSNDNNSSYNKSSNVQEKKKRQSKWDKISPPPSSIHSQSQTSAQNNQGRNLFRGKQDKRIADSSNNGSNGNNSSNYSTNKSKPKESNFTDQPPSQQQQQQLQTNKSSHYPPASSDQQHQQQQQIPKHHHHHNRHNRHHQNYQSPPLQQETNNYTKYNYDRASIVGRDRPSRLSKIEPELQIKRDISSLDRTNKEIISSNLAKGTIKENYHNSNMIPSNFSDTAPNSSKPNKPHHTNDTPAAAAPPPASQSNFDDDRLPTVKAKSQQEHTRTSEKQQQRQDSQQQRKEHQPKKEQNRGVAVVIGSKSGRSNFDKPPSPTSAPKNSTFNSSNKQLSTTTSYQYMIYLLGVPLTIGTNILKNKIMQSMKLQQSAFKVQKITDNANKEGQVCNYVIVYFSSQELVDQIVMNPTFQIFGHPVLCLPQLQDIPITHLIKQHQVTFSPQDTTKAPYGKNADELDNLYKFFKKFGNIVDLNMGHWPHHCLVTYSSAAVPIFLLNKGQVIYKSVRGDLFKLLVSEAPVYDKNTVRSPFVQDEKGFIPSVLYKIQDK